MTTVVQPSTAAARQAAGRSALYSALARGFRYPTPALHQAIAGGGLAQELRQAASGLPYPLDAAVTAPGDLSLAQLQQHYVELFDVGGPGGAPCFLYEGEYGGGRLKVMEDILRFYHHFGLRLSSQEWERPDHLVTELEFMHFLTFQEAALVEKGGAVAPYRQAQRDFLVCHLGDLVSALQEKTAPRQAPLYPALAAILGRFVKAERGHLAS